MRLGADPKIELLRQVPLFAGCSKRGLKEIAGIADEVDVRAGQELIAQGDRGRQFFLLVEGQAEVRRDGDPLRVLGPGDFFGEISLLADRPTTATVTMQDEGRVLVITPRDFRRLLREHEEIQEQVLAALASRLPTD